MARQRAYDLTVDADSRARRRARRSWIFKSPRWLARISARVSGRILIEAVPGSSRWRTQSAGLCSGTTTTTTSWHPTKKRNPPPRASAHLFFVATRDCWCSEPMDDARSSSMSREAARASLARGARPVEFRIMRGRDMRDPADALSGLLETPSAGARQDVVAASRSSRVRQLRGRHRRVAAERRDPARQGCPGGQGAGRRERSDAERDVGDDGRSKLDFAAAGLGKSARHGRR